MGINIKLVMLIKHKILVLFILIFSFIDLNSQDNLIPENFLLHKVRKGETILELSKKYKIDKDLIENYNPQIRKRGLRKRMQLRIPVFKKTPKEKVLPNYYITIPKDTKWRIAYENGISIDELEELNPQIKLGLKIGQKILLPKNSNIIKQTVDDNYYYYKIKPKEGYYRIGLKTGIKKTIIDSLNPLVIKNGLQEGMILKLPKLYFKKLNVFNNFLSEKINLRDSILKRKSIKLAIFLPFNTSSIEFDSVIKTNRFLKKRTLSSIAIDFYFGAITAMQDLVKMGINIDSKIIDTQNDIDEIDNKIKLIDTLDLDLIVGPLLPKNFNFMSSHSDFDNIPKVAPLSSKPVEMRKGVFQSISQKNFLRNKMLSHLKNILIDEDNIIIVADSLNLDVESELNKLFPRSVNIRPEYGDFLLPDLIDSLIVDSMPNKIILETEKFSLISSASSQIRSQLSNEKKIKLFTTYRGVSYDNKNLSNTLFSDLEFTYLSDYYPRSINDSEFSIQFIDRYGIPPNRTAVRAYDLMMDLLLRISIYDDLFKSIKIGETEYFNNKFNYVPFNDESYINEGYYLLKHESYDVIEINK
ncbi:MAG: hypothetical protein CMC81_04725 [Flavobacteriaceae bacterium]|nr:hypothetical protein [Flavobacteriaceae bacterium]